MQNYNFKNTINIPFKKVKEWSKKAYQKAGMSLEDAIIVADVQAIADLRGVYSHGIQKCPAYIKRILENSIDPKAKPEIAKDANAFVMVDGKNAMGQLSAYFAMNVAIERAKKYGSSTITLRGGNHMGTMAYFAQMASKVDMIGICFTQGAANLIAPSGGIEALLGNNPIGCAIPAFSKADVVLDMALSKVAGGKLHIAAIMGQSIPDDWAMDKDGKPTTDPSKFCTLQPIAGYKGYGLAFITTLLTAVLCNGPWGRNQHDLLYDNNPLNISATMQVINIEALMNVEEFKKRVDEAIDIMKNSKKCAGIEEILVPGELEARTEAHQLHYGIKYPEELIDEINDYSRKWGIEKLVK